MEKKGSATDGVGRFFDHSKGFIWGNCFVTSVLQSKGLFIPHLAKMYLKKEDSEEEGIEFRSKLEIALEEIIKPLRLPSGLRLMVVFDCWWFDSDLINEVLDLGYNVTCELKSNKIVLLEDGTSLQVQEYAKRFKKEDFERIEISVRGRKKKYWVVGRVIGLEGIGQVKLVISKKRQNGEPRFFMCTDMERSASEILMIYEDRWNIETNHREANQKLGFKDYMLRGKRAIERFIQVVFAIWTLILIYELESKNKKKKRRCQPSKEVRTMGNILEEVRTLILVEMLVEVLEYFNIPQIEREKGVLSNLRRMGLKT